MGQQATGYIQIEVGQRILIEVTKYNNTSKKYESMGKEYKIELVEQAEYIFTVTHPDFVEPFVFKDGNKQEMSDTLHVGQIFIQRSGSSAGNLFWIRFPHYWNANKEVIK